MKLSQKQLEQVYNEVKNGHHEPVQTIIRFGGDKEDYQKLHKLMRGY